MATSEEEVGLMLLLPPLRAEDLLGLMLLLPLMLLCLARLENTLLEEAPPKEGLDRGELAGVAIRVGVTSLLVMMATVVRLLPRVVAEGASRCQIAVVAAAVLRSAEGGGDGVPR